MGIQSPAPAYNMWLREVDRVFDNGGDRQGFSVPEYVFGLSRLIAARHTIAAQITGLDVGGVGGQRVSFPHASREAAKGVECVLRGMGTPVHPCRQDVTVNGGADLPR